MSEEQPASPPVEAEQEEKRKRKKEEKLRSAWISFRGRIVAQIVGAAATIGHRRRADTQRPAAEGLRWPCCRSRISRDPQQEYFADGMTDALISSLAKIRTLRVISTTSVMQYKVARKPLPEIARELGVDSIVEGAVVRVGPRVRVTAGWIRIWSPCWPTPGSSSKSS